MFRQQDAATATTATAQPGLVLPGQIALREFLGSAVRYGVRVEVPDGAALWLRA